ARVGDWSGCPSLWGGPQPFSGDSARDRRASVLFVLGEVPGERVVDDGAPRPAFALGEFGEELVVGRSDFACGARGFTGHGEVRSWRRRGPIGAAPEGLSAARCLADEAVGSELAENATDVAR